jgi:hypothetical protein
MRGHETQTAIAPRSEKRSGANTHLRRHRPEHSRLLRWYFDHSAVIYDTELISAIVYLKSYQMMIHECCSAAGCCVAVQSGS